MDKYTIVHATVGAMMGMGGAPPWAAFLGTLLWESAEPQLKATMPEVFPRSTLDTPQNKLGDSASMLLAYYIAANLRRERRKR